MEHTNLVASELRQAGYDIKILSTAIRVSLLSRIVRQVEIRAVLDDIFEGCSFLLQRSYDGVIVEIE